MNKILFRLMLTRNWIKRLKLTRQLNLLMSLGVCKDHIDPMLKRHHES